MKVELENVKPKEIETRSFEIITEELGDKKLIPGTECIVKRCIHTSADFDYADNLCFSPNAVEKAIEAIKNGACIVTDTQMAKAGINKKALAKYGGEVYCFMSDEDVAKKAIQLHLSVRAVETLVKNMNEPKSAPEKKQRDINLDKVQDRLQSRFQTRVRIDEKQITIRYDGNEDLNRLLEMLGGIEEE